MAETVPLEKLLTKFHAAGTSADIAYAVLKHGIIHGELAPGSRLRADELAKQLGMSRTPVREALGRLASEGFLERIPHRGFRVPEESIADLLELYPILVTYFKSTHNLIALFCFL